MLLSLALACPWRSMFFRCFCRSWLVHDVDLVDFNCQQGSHEGQAAPFRAGRPCSDWQLRLEVCSRLFLLMSRFTQTIEGFRV